MNLSIENYEDKPEDVKRSVLRLYQWSVDNNLKSVQFVVADEYYYQKTLEQRRDILSAPSTAFLCKTIVFQNTAYDHKFQGPFYPKYIAVMVQYISKVNTQKLNKQLRLYQQKNAPQNKASKQYFHCRLADDKISNQLTGYDHNGVVPVLMKQKIPVIFSHQIENLKPKFFWMGGGHPWTKMRISFDEFKKSSPSEVLVFDITYEKGTNVPLQD